MFDTLLFLSQAFGWLYFLAWSISFYPQVILNHHRKSIEGLSLEFQAYNFTGFFLYGVFTYVTYFVQSDKTNDLSVSVTYNDLAFVTHALILTSVTIIQCVLYYKPNHPLATGHVTLLVVIWSLVFYNAALAMNGILPWVIVSTKDDHFSVVEFLGLVKVFISMFKCMPQAWLNYQRKSTVGWAIEAIFLDFAGGSLSFLQQFIDAYRLSDWTILTGNTPKLFLALVSMGLDFVFFIQHYLLYTDRRDYSVVVDVDSNNFLNNDHKDDMPSYRSVFDTVALKDKNGGDSRASSNATTTVDTSVDFDVEADKSYVKFEEPNL